MDFAMLHSGITPYGEFYCFFKLRFGDTSLPPMVKQRGTLPITTGLIPGAPCRNIIALENIHRPNLELHSV